MSDYLFSKTAYIKGLQCDKHLYLYKHHYKLHDPLSAETLAKFRGGHDFEDAYRAKYFPLAVDIEKIAKNRNDYPKLTQKALQKQVTDILEATFIHNEVLVMNDVLTKNSGQWEIQEIKNSTKLTQTHIDDLALQYYVTAGALEQNLRATLVLPDGLGGYNIIDATSQVQNLQTKIAANIEHFKQVLDEHFIPEIAVGTHCEQPYKCSFWAYCHS